ncbi:MAG: hypothetical protein ACE5G8_07370, partial [Anaerolineae bacterium]
IIRLHTDPQFAADDLRGAAVFLQQAWRPGDTIIVNAGYTYTALRHYYTAPVDRYLRLADFTPGTAQRNPYAPLVLQTGLVNGPPSLGWGDPQSDFYAMSEQETIAALQAVSKQYPRLWVLRAYDTVTDPAGIIRHWLSENTLQFEDRPIGGPSNFRVQGFFSPKQPPPPQQTDDTFAGRFKLRGFTPPGSRYHAGDKIYVTLWLEALAGLSAEPPYAVSLKLWDSRGNMAAQSDEWPAGSLYFSPQWPPGQIVRHPMQLQLPPDTRPGQYWLDVQLYRSDGSVPLPVNGSDKTGVTLGKIEVVGENPGRVAPH